MDSSAIFGRFLRDARELRGLSAEQLADHAGIPVGHIEALEFGKLRAIRGGMYLRAEVRAYADAVGVDPGVALSELHRALGGTPALTRHCNRPRRNPSC